MILVGLDFHCDSWAAVGEARALSRATGMPLKVLHVHEHPDGKEWRPSPEELRVLEGAGVLPGEIQHRQGVPWVEIVRYARETEARIIVAGRHGGSGFQPLALGSTAHRLATSFRTPVLLVSGGPERPKRADQGSGEKSGPEGDRTATTYGHPDSPEAS